MAIVAKSKSEYFDNLETFLQCVIKDNLKLSLQKSVLIEDQCEFSGHLIKDGEITPRQKHFDCIAKMERPKDKASLERVLGSFNWLKNASSDTQLKLMTCISYSIKTLILFGRTDMRKHFNQLRNTY